ncbi:hypothetical protein LZ30DRAFT_357271 [Colletotrichum cereale]|nr:hypothetical protein LZ30DRAFT_357271 [Colletotrichum cereale]
MPSNTVKCPAVMGASSSPRHSPSSSRSEKQTCLCSPPLAQRPSAYVPGLYCAHTTLFADGETDPKGYPWNSGRERSCSPDLVCGQWTAARLRRLTTSSPSPLCCVTFNDLTARGDTRVSACLLFCNQTLPSVDEMDRAIHFVRLWGIWSRSFMPRSSRPVLFLNVPCSTKVLIHAGLRNSLAVMKGWRGNTKTKGLKGYGKRQQATQTDI